MTKWIAEKIAALILVAIMAVTTVVVFMIEPVTYEHVTLTREGNETVFGGGRYSREECKEQVRRAEFLDNNLHYCRVAD